MTQSVDVDTDSVSINRESFPHLTEIEWEALGRLSLVSGEAMVRLILSRGLPKDHHQAAQEFLLRELGDARKLAESRLKDSVRPATESVLKLDTSSYNGDSKGLSLNRWFCELDLAIKARRLNSDFEQTTFLLSKLNGKAKEWAFGRRLSDSECFPNLTSLKEDLRLAFEPPQDETLQRANFFSLKQGRLSMRDYVQKTRELVSNIRLNPIDITTQVHVFISGMNPGFQRFYLTRKSPKSLEDAFATALREDYSVLAASQLPTGFQTPVDPNAMEIDAMEVKPTSKSASQKSKRRDGQNFSKKLICYRCQKSGHRAQECRAPAPVARALNAVQDDDHEQPKNDENQ